MEKEKTPPSNDRNKIKNAAANFFRTRKGRITFAAVIVFLALALTAFAGIWLPMQMFTRNPRFTLTRLELKTHPAGYWAGKEKKAAQILELDIGKNNLFKLPVKTMKKRLEERCSIAEAGVRKILPDTLQIEIRERIPRALLNSEKSLYIVDENCILMTRLESMNITESLPVILGVPGVENYPLGTAIPLLEDIMEYLNLARTTWSSIRFEKIVLKKDVFLCAVRYRNHFGPVRVTLPRKNANVKMQELATALERLLVTNSTKRDIDLQYEKRAILRDLPRRR